MIAILDSSESGAEHARSGRVREIADILGEVLAGYRVSEPSTNAPPIPLVPRFEPLPECAAAAVLWCI